MNSCCLTCTVGLPSNFSQPDYKPPADVPCVVHLLCQRHEGLEMEAKEIKEFWWKPYIRKLFDKKVSTVHCISVILLLFLAANDNSCVDLLLF